MVYSGLAFPEILHLLHVDEVDSHTLRNTIREPLSSYDVILRVISFYNLHCNRYFTIDFQLEFLTGYHLVLKASSRFPNSFRLFLPSKFIFDSQKKSLRKSAESLKTASSTTPSRAIAITYTIVIRVSKLKLRSFIFVIFIIICPMTVSCCRLAVQLSPCPVPFTYLGWKPERHLFMINMFWANGPGGVNVYLSQAITDIPQLSFVTGTLKRPSA